MFKNAYITTPRFFALFIVLASALPLAGALLSQYGFGLHPCDLCIYQRIPYAIALFFGVVFLVIGARIPLIFMALILLLWLAGSGIAGFHVGVEEGWWQGLEGCSTSSIPGSLEELRAQIEGASFVRCDEVAFRFLGLSMAGWNMLYAITISVLGAVVWRKQKISKH